MCGIVGAVAERNIVPILIEGLRRLEYRGYDSAGVAVVDDEQRIGLCRTVGKVAELEAKLDKSPLNGRIGVAHTRWATHGGVTEENAHPHLSGRIAVIHNGIIENFAEIKNELLAKGYEFQSETDTEVAAHLVHDYVKQGLDLVEAVGKAVERFEGAYALLVVDAEDPERIVVSRVASPLVIGLGLGENFVASGVPALLPVTQRFIYLEQDDLAEIRRDSVRIYDADRRPVEREVHETQWDSEAAEKGPYRHFMLKEIFDQPSALADTLHGRIEDNRVLPESLGPKAKQLLIALIPLLGASGTAGALDPRAVVVGIGALVALVVIGRLLLRPVLQIVSHAGIPELFTAMALLVVTGAALLMYAVGLSMVLGAFLAGMLLADSEYRHQLEADIAPFKGLLLGLFFIAVGMTVDVGRLLREPAEILLIVFLLMGIKALVLYPLARRFGMCNRKASLRVAAAMSQGGEFAFVLFSLATREGILPGEVNTQLTLAVTLSMLLTPIIYTIVEHLTRRPDASEEPDYDAMDEKDNPVLIAGFGRVGQIIGRMLRVVGQPFTALEYDAAQVRLVRSYGNKVYFGDATRLDTLRAAGAADARMLIIATAKMDTSLRIAETAKQHFPDLTIVARARNRRHVHKLIDVGVDYTLRDTLLSSVAISEEVLKRLGFTANDAAHVAKTFLERDKQLLEEQQAVHHSEEKLIQTSRETAIELEALLREDLGRKS